jgi:cytochrome c6
MKIIFLFFIFFNIIHLNFFEKGEKLFELNCISCHVNGNNSILPEKDLKKETLESLGINNRTSLIYQINNGKNGMPAFGGRLKTIEIEQITSYIMKE